MTNNLREQIKRRDGYKCVCCGASLEDEPHLLLEIDRIIPVSKGGKTLPENLQTLCWRCNRSKSDKLIIKNGFVFTIIFIRQIFLILVCVLQKFDIKYVSWEP